MGTSLSHRLARANPPPGERKKCRHTLDRLKEVPSHLETSVGAVLRLGSESHGGTVAASSASLLVVCTTSVPCQPNKNLKLMLALQEPFRFFCVGNHIPVHSCHHRSRLSRQEDGRSHHRPSGSLPWLGRRGRWPWPSHLRSGRSSSPRHPRRRDQYPR